MEIKRIPVESSNVKSIGYDPESQTLEVAFSSGGLYRYADVPPDAYHNRMVAPSKGGYFAAHIKPKYAASKMGQEEKQPDAPSELDRLRVIRNMLSNLCLTGALRVDMEERYSAKAVAAWMELQRLVAESMNPPEAHGG